MKLLVLIPCLFLIGCAHLQVAKYTQPIRAAVSRADDKTVSAKTHVQKASDFVDQINQTLAAPPEVHQLAVSAKAELDATQQNLDDARVELRTAQKRTDDLEVAAQSFIAKYEAALRRYDKLRFAIACAAAAGAGFLFSRVPPWIVAFAGPYAWAGYIVVPAATWTLVWFALNWIL